MEGVTPLVESRYASESSAWLEEIDREVEAQPRGPRANELRAVARRAESVRDRSPVQARRPPDPMPTKTPIESERRPDERELASSAAPAAPERERSARADRAAPIETREVHAARAPDARAIPVRTVVERLVDAPSKSPIQPVLERMVEIGSAEPRERVQATAVREAVEISTGVDAATASVAPPERASGSPPGPPTRSDSPALARSRAPVAHDALPRELVSNDREEVVEIHIGRIDARVERSAAPAKPARRGTTLRAYLDKRRARDE